MMTVNSVYPVEEFDFESSFRSVKKLCDRWIALRHGEAIAPFEEIAIGSLGLLADDTAVLVPAGDDIELVRIGSGARRLIGFDGGRTLLSRLTPNFRAAIGSTVRRALAQQRPVLTTIPVLVARSVGTCEFLAMPVRTHWGEDVAFGYLRQRPLSYDMVDAIYLATNEGLLALTAVPTQSGQSDFQIVSLNAGAARLFGRAENDLCWGMLSDALPATEFARIRPLLSETLRSGVPQHFGFTLRSPAGGEVHLRVSAAPMGDLIGLALTDVTEVLRKEASIRLLFGSNPTPLVLYDPADGQLMQANDAFLERYGYTVEQLVRLRVSDLLPAGSWVDAAAHEAERQQTGRGGRERSYVTACGDVRDVLVYSRNLPFEGRDCVIASIVDVTDQRRAEKQIAYLAHHDAITGLANRVLFKAGLTASLAVSSRDRLLAIHCIDLDGFKQVNDTFGHPAGDALLTAVAGRLRTAVKADDLVARLGGDEFAIVQSRLASAEEASAMASRLIALLSVPYDIDGQPISVGASIGVALAPLDGPDADQLLKNADIALYRAKSDGRGTYAFFEPAMQESIQARRRLEADLRMALVRHELSVKYQPLVDVASGRIIGCEALLRWNQPDHGAISPANFIPLAEETGLIIPIGEWVLRQACTTAATWAPHLTVAVNLSPVQFKSRGLVGSVANALAASGLPAARLELEITESVLLADSEANLTTLRRLRLMGVKISMDDFGTGYSSLSYLRAFPFDKIKIDKSFIADLDVNEDCRAIVRAVVGLGASLGIKTLAEGVETEEQLARLTREGCQQVQGYLLSPPVGPEDLLVLLGSRRDDDAIAA